MILTHNVDSAPLGPPPEAAASLTNELRNIKSHGRSAALPQPLTKNHEGFGISRAIIGQTFQKMQIFPRPKICIFWEKETFIRRLVLRSLGVGGKRI